MIELKLTTKEINNIILAYILSICIGGIYSGITLEKVKFIDGFLMGVISYLFGIITIPVAIFMQSIKIVNLFSDDIGIEFTVAGVSFIAYMVLLIFFIIKYKKTKELKHLFIIFILFLYPAFQMGKMFDTFTGF